MKKLIITTFTTLSMALAAPVFAQNHSAHADHGASTASTASSNAEAVMTAGKITRVDARSGKLTIRHEDIKNLDMPAMTMVFALADSAKPADFKTGDKVLFHAEDKDGTLIITRIQPAS